MESLHRILERLRARKLVVMEAANPSLEDTNNARLAVNLYRLGRLRELEENARFIAWYRDTPGTRVAFFLWNALNEQIPKRTE